MIGTRLRSTALALSVSAGLMGTAAVAEATPATGLTCRGAGIDPAAQLHHRTETPIKAPAAAVWRLQPGRCVRWTGPAIGDGLRIDRGGHVWTFTPVRGGMLVRTEESWTGEQIEADPALRYLAAGLDAWLADLNTPAEAR